MNTASDQRHLAPTNYCGLVNNHTSAAFPEETRVYRCISQSGFDEISVPTYEETSQDLYFPATGLFISRDYSNDVLNFISHVLMEDDDLENEPCMMLHADSLALQATEESLYNVINNSESSNCTTGQSLISFASLSDCNNLNIPFGYSTMTPFSASTRSSSTDGLCLQKKLSDKKNRCREDDDNDLLEVQRSNKQVANNFDESQPHELCDSILLCSEFNSLGPCYGKNEEKKQSNRGRPKRVKEIIVTEVMVDLRSLLIQCAQAVASYDSKTVSNLLMHIRKHSSPHGDGYERVAHYFSNALEARTTGTGPVFHTGYIPMHISPSEILRAYSSYVDVCPFRKVSNLVANRTIMKLSVGANTLHVVDFGILFGYQWPRLIQLLSERPGGPPKLRITGIDFPQPGLRPAQRLVDAGITLKKCCERFGVQFEYIAIAQKWETVKIEDLKFEENELLVVNSLYSLHNVPTDETSMTDNSPRDDVMNLIKKINPDIFIHGTVNGNHNMPVFATRFREALFHYSSMFDMFEVTVSKQDECRLMYEEEVLGRDVMNIVSCEGTQRVERPETYKQWQVRCKRAGFKQMPFDREIMNFVRRKVKKMYNRHFLLDEDGDWVLQGWKGRVNNALSFWQPDK